jgi:hypothetical protein
VMFAGGRKAQKVEILFQICSCNCRVRSSHSCRRSREKERSSEAYNICSRNVKRLL